MKYKNVYFVNGNAYAGKSTIVKMLANKYNGILCEENYHNQLLDTLDPKEFPGLTYTRDLIDWRHFIRRSPDEYEQWIKITTKECEQLELLILDKLINCDRPIFVDTNISLETLLKISDKDHVLIMLADPEISINRFFEREDRDKQFLYKLLTSENNPTKALNNFKECLKRINSIESYNYFKDFGFNIIFRDDNRSLDETLSIAEKKLKLI